MIIHLQSGKLCISGTNEDLSHVPTAKRNHRLARWEVAPFFASQILKAYPNARATQEVRNVTEKFYQPAVVPIADLPPYEFLGPAPADHQVRGFQLLQEHDKFGLFWEMGTRKTATTLYDIDARIDSGRSHRALIICPLPVANGWVKDARRFIKRGIEPIIGTPSQKKNAIRSVANIFVTNYDSLRRFGEDIQNIIQPDLVVLDESHNIKSPRALRTRSCLELAESATTKRVLTGTPIAQNQLDLFCQMKFLDSSILPWPSWFAFSKRFGISVPMGGFTKIVGVRDEEEIAAMVAPHVDQLTFDECFDMPPWTDVRIECDMNGKQKQAYAEMKKELLTLIAGNNISAQNAAVQLTKLRQIAGGTLKDDNGEVHILGTPKIDELKNIMGEVRSPVVIWTTYRAETELVSRELNCPLIYGGMTHEDRTRILDEFEAGKHPALAAQIDSLSEGVNELVAAHIEVRYSYSFKFIAWVQSRARLRRSGQQTDVPCRSIQLVTTGSTEEKCMAAVDAKSDVATKTLGQIRELLTG